MSISGWQPNTELILRCTKYISCTPAPPNVFTVRRAFIYFLCLIDNIQSISSANASFICMYVQDIQECLKISSSKAAQMITKKELKN